MIEEVIVQKAIPLDFQGVIQRQFELRVVPPFWFQFHCHFVGHPVEDVAQLHGDVIILDLAAQVFRHPPVFRDHLEPGVIEVFGVVQEHRNLPW